MRPFLRWAGGKRWFAESTDFTTPQHGIYLEPFLGGGAFFFGNNINLALLSDMNEYLINAYIWMRDDPIGLFNRLQEHFAKHSSLRYYSVRESLCPTGLAGAADFIYLNRSCFNGLFRVNLAGRFNVPVGSKVYPLDNRAEFVGWSNRLQQAEIALSDFEPIVDRASAADFLFLDPPYTVNHNENGFIEYNEKIFGWDDQVRLHESLMKAKARGADFILTNADHETVRELWKNCDLASVERGSEMAGKTAFRGRTTELVVTSIKGPAFAASQLPYAVPFHPITQLR